MKIPKIDPSSSRYFIRFVTVDDRVVEPSELASDDIRRARHLFRDNLPRFFRDVRSTSLVSRVSGRVLSKEAF